jgi:hypothetical protein
MTMFTDHVFSFTVDALPFVFCRRGRIRVDPDGPGGVCGHCLLCSARIVVVFREIRGLTVRPAMRRRSVLEVTAGGPIRRVVLADPTVKSGGEGVEFG